MAFDGENERVVQPPPAGWSDDGASSQIAEPEAAATREAGRVAVPEGLEARPRAAMPALRLAAVLEVFACSGFPTQLLLAGLLQLAGIDAFDGNRQLNTTYVFAVTIADALLVIALVVWFLRLHGERFGEVMFGGRPIALEGLVGIFHIPLVFVLAALVLALVHTYAPSMRDIPKNPMEGMIRSPLDAWLFGFVAVLGGGVREEIQRAFILHRFRHYLGGPWIGLIAFSAVFGLGHLVQGRDVAITTAALGAFWGFVYIRRRSIAASVISHSGFNAAEIFRYTLYRV